MWEKAASVACVCLTGFLIGEGLRAHYAEPRIGVTAAVIEDNELFSRRKPRRLRAMTANIGAVARVETSALCFLTVITQYCFAHTRRQSGLGRL